jgi:cobalt-zinc-cadmium efflux system membrane fusion protein
MRYFRRSLTLCALLALGLGGCRKQAAPPEEHHQVEGASSAESAHDHGAHTDLPRRVRVSDEVLKDAGVQVIRVTKAALTETLSLPGEVSADPDRVARISTPSSGRLEQVTFREGVPVKKGELLAVVRVPEIAKVRATRSATASRAQAMRANAQRLRALAKEGLGLDQDAVNAESEAAALEQESRSAAELLATLGAGATGAASISLRAPLAGTVVSRDAVIGQPVTDEQTLGTIANLDEVWFLARVFEKDLSRLKAGVTAEVHLNAYPHEHFAGTVEYIGQQIDPIGRTVTARVRVKNKNELLRIGLFGVSQISLDGPAASEPKLVVPQASVTEIAGKSVVFVREAPNEFELHEVTLGRESLGRREILAGLRENEEVVSDGVFSLKSIVLKGSFAEDEH